MPGEIVTIGYEGRTLDEFISTLTFERVEVLVDVRLNAISRKPGFSKTALMNAARAAGIEYVHEPMLGNPISNRDGYRAGQKSARTRYQNRLANGSSVAVDRLVEVSTKRRVAVLCFERDHETCHRNQLVEIARQREPGLHVKHAD